MQKKSTTNKFVAFLEDYCDWLYSQENNMTEEELKSYLYMIGADFYLTYNGFVHNLDSDLMHPKHRVCMNWVTATGVHLGFDSLEQYRLSSRQPWVMVWYTILNSFLGTRGAEVKTSGSANLSSVVRWLDAVVV